MPPSTVLLFRRASAIAVYSFLPIFITSLSRSIDLLPLSVLNSTVVDQLPTKGFFRDACGQAQTALLCGSLHSSSLDGQSEVRAVSLRCGVFVLLRSYAHLPSQA